MSDAIELFYYTFSKIYNFLFNEAIIEEGVSVGWIFITVLLFGLIINTLLNIPNGLHYGSYSSDYFDSRGVRVGHFRHKGFNRGNEVH